MTQPEPVLTGLVLRDVTYGDPVSQPLIDELQAEMVARYGGPDETPVDPTEFAPPRGVFVVAERNSVLVACAGLRGVDDTTVELKRMYVRAEQRRSGVARALLAALEGRARAMGADRIVLETGTAQPEAIALYASAGYDRIHDFGHYRGEPESRAFAKAL